MATFLLALRRLRMRWMRSSMGVVLCYMNVNESGFKLYAITPSLPRFAII